MEYIDLTKENGGISDESYIPSGTVITIGASGADFTSVQDALSSLNNKWSNGTVKITIESGTYNETATALTVPNISCPMLIIEGANTTTYPIINCPTSGFYIQNTSPCTTIRYLDIRNSAKTETNNNIRSLNPKGVFVNNVKISNSAFGFLGENQGLLEVKNSFATNCNYAVTSNNAIVTTNGTITLNGITTAYGWWSSGIIKTAYTTLNSTNVTNVFMHPKNQVTGDGVCYTYL